MNTLLQTPTPDLEQSLGFYSKLGFKVISSEKPFVVSDGQTFIEINPDRYARAGLKLYNPDWKEVVNKLSQTTIVLEIDEGYLLNDPSGIWVYLVQSESNFDFIPSQKGCSVLGNCAGISLEVIGIPNALSFWEVLGFTKTSGDESQGWVSISNNDQVGISLMKPNMCPHLFFNPSLTYFNGKNNDQVIASIRELDIPITEEITHFNKEGLVDNIIIRDPGGLGFFIFND